MAEIGGLSAFAGVGLGITIWNLQIGDRLMHIPTYASPPHGLLCLRDQFFVASYVNKHGFVGGGAIYTWPFNKHMTWKWIIIIANVVMEILSAVFGQLSSVQKPQYALITMIMSFATVLISVIDLAHMGGRGGVKWMWRGSIPWFYSPHPNHKPLGSFADIIGLVCGILQCIFETISYAFLSQHAENPIKISIWPIIFAFGVLCSSFPWTNQRNISRIPETQLLPHNKVLAEFAEEVTKGAEIASRSSRAEDKGSYLEVQRYFEVFSN